MSSLRFVLRAATLLVALPLTTPAFAQPAPAPDCSDAKAHFEIAREIGTPEAFQAHIDSFGSCPYAAFARILKGKAEAATGPGPAPNTAAAPAAQGTPPPALGVAASPAAPTPAAQDTTVLVAPAAGSTPLVPSAPASADVTPADAATMATAFVDRLNAMPFMAATQAPKVGYGTATRSNDDIAITNLTVTLPAGQGGRTERYRFDTALIQGMQIAPDGTLRSSRLQLSHGINERTTTGVWSTDQDYPSLTIDSVTIDNLVLSAPGAAAASDAVAPVSFAGLFVFGITARERTAPAFTIDNAQVTFADVTGGLPSKVVFSTSGLTFTPEQLAAISGSAPRAFQALGYDKFTFDILLGVTRDPAAGTLSIDTASLDLRDAGGVNFTANLADVDDAWLTQAKGGDPMAALADMPITLVSARLYYTDKSLTQKGIAVAAAAQNVDKTLFSAAIPSLAGSAVAGATGSQSFGNSVSQELTAYLAAPKGFWVEVRPEQPALLRDLVSAAMSGANPSTLFASLGPSFSVNDRPSVPFVLGDAGNAANDAPAVDTAALAQACDTLAADSDDPGKPADVEGVQSASDIDHEKAVPACEAAHSALPADPRIAFELGRSYAAAGKDEDAVRLYREAADAGQPVAAYELGLDYLDGRGVPADPKQAIDLLRKSSDAGFGFAKYRLAVEEVNGTNIPADYPGAASLFADAAAAGVTDSLTELGKMNYRGQLGAADYAKAFDYFRQAAAKDVASGSFYVGFMEALGYGENPTAQDAVFNMMKALLAGDPDAESIIVDDQGKAFGLPVRKAIQDYLRGAGYFKGKSDGTLGAETQSAITAWISAKGHG